MIFTPQTIPFFFFAFIKRKIAPHPTIQQQQIEEKETQRKREGKWVYLYIVG
jgi:hypothetical protein